MDASLIEAVRVSAGLPPEAAARIRTDLAELGIRVPIVERPRRRSGAPVFFIIEIGLAVSAARFFESFVKQLGERGADAFSDWLGGLWAVGDSAADCVELADSQGTRIAFDPGVDGEAVEALFSVEPRPRSYLVWDGDSGSWVETFPPIV